MNNQKDDFDHQQSLDALLADSQLHTGYNNADLQFPDMLGQLRPHPQASQQQQGYEQQHAYSSETPAQQHEKLLYMNNKVNFLPEGDAGSYHSINHAPVKKSASFLDDETFSNDNKVDSDSARASISNVNCFSPNGPDGSYREPSVEQQQTSMGQENQGISGPDFLFHRGDDAMFSFADELGSSVGSSMNSEFLGSSYSSSFSFQPQSLNGPSNPAAAGVANISQHLLPIVRSPASSVRASSYLSTSLRNGNVGTPGTPKTRHTSVSSNINADAFYSSSVPRSLSHLSAEEKLRRKREFHNAVERRRRELIKQKIKELGTIVPPSLLNYNNNGKQIKPNKGIILNKTVEYLEYLLHVLEIQDRKKIQLTSKIQELENKKQLQKRLTENTYEGPVPTAPQNEGTETAISQPPTENEYEGIDTDVSQERIIDGRAKPQPFSNNAHWNSETNIYNNLSSAELSKSSGYNEIDSSRNNTIALDGDCEDYNDNDHRKNSRSGSHHNTNDNNENMPSISDDLEQFLSGALIEAEDNAKLLFNSGHPSADYLLEFDT